MPLYEYAPSTGSCEKCGGRFEVFQRIADPKLTQCPECGKACERLISAVTVTGKFSTSDSKVRDLGMTKYKKTSDGSYERVVGTGGPKMIRNPADTD